jgi:hypothetical protein
MEKRSEMATAWVTPKVGQMYPKNQDQDRLVRKIDANTVEVEVWKVDKKGITVGSETVEMASSEAPFMTFVKLTGGEAEVRKLARQAKFVKIRAAIGAENGKGNGSKKGY